MDERPAPETALALLSSSRSSDFKSCPLKYRFRTIDRLPETPSPAATRGTIVHSVLEHLFDLGPAERTPDAALAMVEPEWRAALALEPELAGLFPGDDGSAEAEWLESARQLVRTYFTLEDPRQVEPDEREAYVCTALPALGIEIHGYLDRVDVLADGGVVVSDYKTGRSPRDSYEEQALFQMKFYALLIWRTRGVLPKLMRLVYLGDGVQCSYEPDADNLLRFERLQLGALGTAISRALETGDWRPRRSRLCDWCDFQAFCPEFGGTVPPLPERDVLPLLASGTAEICTPEG